MGGSYSKEDEELFMADLFSLAQETGLMPDIDIDGSLTRYLGSNSTAELESYSSQLLMDAVGRAPNFVAGLGAAIAAFKGVPNAVGLGALIISFILDLALIPSGMSSSDDTLNMLRRVFAEEKASGVRDSMDEYIKRLSMHMREPSKALRETERLEEQLSDQLTRLRNSMLTDDQMSTRAMKHWINGAAFHSQMLVHAARLRMTGSNAIQTDLAVHVASISTVIRIYQKDLQDLLDKHKNHKRFSIRLEKSRGGLPCFKACPSGDYCRVRDFEIRRFTPDIKHPVYDNRYCENSLDAYLDYMFKNWSLIKKLNAYFSDLKENVTELILQHQTLNVENISPDSMIALG